MMGYAKEHGTGRQGLFDWLSSFFVDLIDWLSLLQPWFEFFMGRSIS
jgi:hypothetical protein